MLSDLKDARLGEVYSAVSHSLLGHPFLAKLMQRSAGGRHLDDYPDKTDPADGKFVHRHPGSIVAVFYNGTGGTLNPGEGIALAAAAFPATATAKSSNTLPSIVHAVVDPFVTSVASTEYFLGIIAGLCKFKNEESGTITALDKIMPGGTTAGRFATISTTPGSATIARNEAVSCCGQALETSSDAVTEAGALVLGMKFRQLW